MEGNGRKEMAEEGKDGREGKWPPRFILFLSKSLSCGSRDSCVTGNIASLRSKPAGPCRENDYALLEHILFKMGQTQSRYFTKVDERGFPIHDLLASEFGVIFILGYVVSYMLVSMGIFNVILGVYVEITMKARHPNVKTALVCSLHRIFRHFGLKRSLGLKFHTPPIRLRKRPKLIHLSNMLVNPFALLESPASCSKSLPPPTVHFRPASCTCTRDQRCCEQF